MTTPKRAATCWALIALAALVPAAGGAQEADLTEIGFDMGDPNAPVLVVEYADFACSACGEFARSAFPTIRRDFIDSGRVRWKLVLFELGFRNSGEGARTAQCGARLGDFWTLHDAVYDAQKDWVAERKPEDALTAIAVSTGIDETEFSKCWDDNPGEDATKEANRAARKDGVRATPTFFIDGFRIQGALPTEVFAQALEAAEKRKRSGDALEADAVSTGPGGT